MLSGDYSTPQRDEEEAAHNRRLSQRRPSRQTLTQRPSLVNLTSSESKFPEPHHSTHLDVICTMILSRVAECVRFRIDKELYGTKVNKDTFEGLLCGKEFSASKSFDLNVENALPRQSSNPLSTLSSSTNLESTIANVGGFDAEEDEDRREKTRKKFGELWERVERHHSAGSLDMTFGELLAYECGGFPQTTRDQRSTLLQLSRGNQVIHKDEVVTALNLDADHPIVRYLFSSGAEALPGEILQDVVGCLAFHPTNMSFQTEFSSAMVRTGRRMMTFLPYIALVLTALIVLPSVVGVQHYSAMQTVLHFIEADWSTGCPKGTTSVIGCNFIQRNMNEIETVEFDAMRFVREELVLRLWQAPKRSAAETPLGYADFHPVGPVGSVYLAGALVVRLTAADQSRIPLTGTPASSVSCQDLNLTTGRYEVRSDIYLDCDALWATVIPFNATQEEALNALTNAPLALASDIASAYVLQFPAFQPSTGLIVYTTITLALPAGGHVDTRANIDVIDTDAHEKVVPLVVINVLICVVSIAFAALDRASGKSFFDFDLVIDFVLLILISASYGMMRSLEDLNNLFQVDSVVKHADEVGWEYHSALLVLAVWAFILLALTSRYLQEVGGLHVVVAILSFAALQILSLMMIFGIWTVCFALIANVFFGNISMAMATPYSAFTVIIQFFNGGGDYVLFQRLHPVLGPTFWFIFTVFVQFFALNLIIAVLTAPLETVKEESNLHLEMHALCSTDVESDPSNTWLKKQKYYLQRRVAPAVNLLFDASPMYERKMRWIRLERLTMELDKVHDSSRVIETLEAGIDLVDSLSTSATEVPFDTPLANKVMEEGCLDPISQAYVLQSIASITTSSLVRDARLNKALRMYDKFATSIQKLLTTQRALQENAARMSTPPSAVKAEELLRSNEASAVFATANLPPPPGEEGKTEIPAENGSKAEEKADAKDDPKSSPKHELEFVFLFTEHISEHIDAQRLSMLWFVLTATLFLWFFITGMTLDTGTSFLSASLDAALRDFPIHQECYDENCTSAFTFRKTFMDSGDLADWYVWMDKVFMRQVYLPGEESQLNRTSVFWDRRTTLKPPVYLRQLRGQPIPCHFDQVPATGPWSGAFYQNLRAGRVATTRCFTGPEDDFARGDMAIPATGLPPLMEASFYRHQDTCPEVRKYEHYGKTDIYRCRGHIAAAHNATQLRSILNSTWVDDATRLVVVTATFRTGNEEVEYSLVAELGVGGGTTHTQTIATPLSEDRGVLEYLFWTTLMWLTVDLVIFCGYSIILIRERGIANFKPPVDFPFSVIVTYIFGIIIPYALYDDPAHNERLKLQLGVVALALTHRATVEVFFPIAGLMSKEATKLYDTLSNAALQCATVVPFYFVFLFALAYSGMVAFGSNANDYALLRYALLQVIRGALGDWNEAALQNVRPELATMYSTVFFAVVMIMLANLVLAMVTSAANDALAAPPSVELAERICRVRGWHVFHGKIGEFMLAWNIWWLKRTEDTDSSETFRKLATLTVGEQRLLFLSEAVVTALGPNRANEVLFALRLDQVHPWLHATAIMVVLQHHADYELKSMVADATDRRREHILLLREEAARNARLNGSSRGGGANGNSSGANNFDGVHRIQSNSHNHNGSRTTPISWMPFGTDVGGSRSASPEVAEQQEVAPMPGSMTSAGTLGTSGSSKLPARQASSTANQFMAATEINGDCPSPNVVPEESSPE